MHDVEPAPHFRTPQVEGDPWNRDGRRVGPYVACPFGLLRGRLVGDIAQDIINRSKAIVFRSPQPEQRACDIFINVAHKEEAALLFPSPPAEDWLGNLFTLLTINYAA